MKHTYALAQFPEIGLNFFRLIYYSHSEEGVNNSYFLIKAEKSGLKKKWKFFIFSHGE